MALALSKNKEMEPNKHTINRSAVGNSAGWAKANFNSCTDLGAKELDSKLPHCFSAAGVPTNADDCLEAVQSNLTEHSVCFLLGLWDM